MVLMFSLNSNAQIVKAEIRATGLTCSMCSNAINKQLKTVPELVNVEIDLNSNTFTVTLKEGNELSPKIFKEKVEKAGFFIGSLVVTAKSNTITQSSYIMVNDKKSNASEIQFQVVDNMNINTYASNNEDDFHIKMIN